MSANLKNKNLEEALEDVFAAIEQYRKQDSLSVEAMCSKIDIYHQHYYSFKHHRCNPTLKTISGLAASMGKKIKIIFL